MSDWSTVVLKREMPAQGWMKRPAISATLIFAFMIGLLLVLELKTYDPAKGSFLAHTKLAHDPRAIAFLFLPFILGYLWLMDLCERVIVNDQGIAYRSPFQGMFAALQRFQPDWKIAWPDIRSAHFAPPSRGEKPIRWRLIIIGKDGERTLHPLLWMVEPPSSRFPPLKLNVLRLDREKAQAALPDTPLVKLMAAHGHALGDAPQHVISKPAFDLLKNPASILLLVVLACSFAYALADSLLNPFIYAVRPSPLPYVIAAAMAYVLALQIGRGLPKLERNVLPLIVAVAIAWVVHPLMLRVNELTAQRTQTYAYRQTAQGVFEPTDHDLPELRFVAPASFWNHLHNGSAHDFVMLRGALGFWQVDMRPLYQEMADYNDGLRTRESPRSKRF